MSKKFLLIIPAFLACASCASVQDWYTDTICNSKAAFKSGMNDGANNLSKQRDYAVNCADDDRKMINTYYSRGYKYGNKNPSVRKAI